MSPLLPSSYHHGPREAPRRKGQGAFLWSADVPWAYHQFRAAPLAQPLFGILVDGRQYVDIALPFGCRTSSVACVRITGTVAWLMRRQSFHAIVYVDDFVGSEASLVRVRQAFNCRLANCSRLGPASPPTSV